ncbi:hypothetical protein AGOR_G00119670 [Albula goreensis]|uniref:Immunoglobulin V-set domain-containing protein n=1 Tax=Albula goreensis TaxID=1534307 RepID=A0A8T3DIJ9_9TELE|nr:hypothetical protein AGOR_G00119670 [Albula goreensis]
MDTYRMKTLFCLLVAGSVCIHLSLAWKVQIPDTVSAVEGSCVIVPCQTGTHQRVIWFQYHSINWPKVYDSQNPASVIPHFRGRTSLLGSAAEGNCSLKIEAVRPEDNGVKLYPWIDPDKSSSQKYQKSVLIRVTGFKAVPHISGQGAVIAGSNLTLACSMLHSCPTHPPPLIWSGLSGGHVSNISVAWDVQRGVWSSTAKLSLLASWRHHQSNVSCATRLGSGVTRTSVAIRLNVSWSGGQPELRQQRKPPPVSYRWLEAQDGEPILANSTLGKGAEITAYARRGSSYSCVAQNPYGELRSPWLPLDVHFPPAILPGSNCSETDGALACVCRVEAHPNATLRWDVNGNDVPASLTSVVQHSSRETVANLTGPIHQLLNVSCTASNTIGNITYYLPIAITPGLSKKGVLTAMVCGSVILVVTTVFICWKFCKRRMPLARLAQSPSVCPTPCSSSELSHIQKPPRSQRKHMPFTQSSQDIAATMGDSYYSGCEGSRQPQAPRTQPDVPSVYETQISLGSNRSEDHSSDVDMDCIYQNC